MFDGDASYRHLGSPPQVRGKLLIFRFRGKSARITPAGAGKTIRHISDCSISVGSPPQVRGKRPVLRRPFRQRGITPAGAGKTANSSCVQTVLKDHPRRCGENADVASRYPWMRGSPPQVRGKLNSIGVSGNIIRITPAGAGKTIPSLSRPFASQDHPRRCGENPTMPPVPDFGDGSPPQVRGKHDKKRKI